MNLLIVEDEKRMAELLRKGLEEEGHTVVCAADGLEGLALSRGLRLRHDHSRCHDAETGWV